MSGPSFTPAPWAVGNDEAGKPQTIWGSGGLVIAGCWDDSYGDDSVPEVEANANARLIAAAPELYEALDRIWNGDGLTVEAKLAAQAALAKARGEAA